MVICLQLGADLHMTQLMPLPLTVFCFSKIQIGFAYLVPAHLGSPRKRAVKRVCVCVCVLEIGRAGFGKHPVINTEVFARPNTATTSVLTTLDVEQLH